MPPSSSIFRVYQKARLSDGAFEFITLSISIWSQIELSLQFKKDEPFDVTVFVGCHDEDHEGHEDSQLWCGEAGAKEDVRDEATETVATGRAFEHAIGIWDEIRLRDVQKNLKAV